MSIAMQGLVVEPLFTLPPGCVILMATNDGHVIASSTAVDGRSTSCWDGLCGEPFDTFMELRDGSLGAFASADGNHLAIAGVRGDRGFVWRDGIEDRPWDDVSRSVPPVFDRTGRHLAYGARIEDGSYRLILDGEPVGSAQVAPISAVFSDDGERLAYVEMQGGEGRSEVEVRVVLDGVPGGWFRGMRNAGGVLQFSPDGKRFAHYVTDGRGHAHWVVDGQAHRDLDDNASLSLARVRGIGVVEPPLPARFSPDGRRFAYAGDVKEGVAMLEDDVAGPLFKSCSGPAFSHDSQHLAYSARTAAGETVLILDGAEVGRWGKTKCGSPVFAADGRTVALTLESESGGFLRRRSVWTVVLGGKQYDGLPGKDAAAFPAISKDGRHVAIWVQADDAKTHLVIDGVDQAADWSVESDLAFSDAGVPVYAGSNGSGQTVIVGDVPGPVADLVVRLRTVDEAFGRDPWAMPPLSFRITPGGGTAWAGRFGEKDRPVLDQEVGPDFDVIVACRVDEHAVTWWAQRGETVYRLRRPLDLGAAAEIGRGVATTA